MIEDESGMELTFKEYLGNSAFLVDLTEKNEGYAFGLRKGNINDIYK